MKSTVVYEWSVETINEDGDIEDISFYDSFSELPVLELNQRVCLVRSEGNEDAGVTDRLWAYITDGKMPEYFENANGLLTGYKVPVKYLSCFLQK